MRRRVPSRRRGGGMCWMIRVRGMGRYWAFQGIWGGAGVIGLVGARKRVRRM